MIRVVNLFAGPGTGKSTTCAALFAELKYRGHNVEMVLEYAKSAAWEGRLVSGSKIAKAQEYIFGKQSFGLSRVGEDVEFCITDAPLLMGIVYSGDNFRLPALHDLIKEAHDDTESLNIFLRRNKGYNPKGRLQTEEEAKEIDGKIITMLNKENVNYCQMDFGRHNVDYIIKVLEKKGWM
jgi:hypothetical protein